MNTPNQIARDLLKNCAISFPDYSMVATALRRGENRQDILDMPEAHRWPEAYKWLKEQL